MNPFGEIVRQGSGCRRGARNADDRPAPWTSDGTQPQQRAERGRTRARPKARGAPRGGEPPRRPRSPPRGPPLRRWLRRRAARRSAGSASFRPASAVGTFRDKLTDITAGNGLALPGVAASFLWPSAFASGGWGAVAEASLVAASSTGHPRSASKATWRSPRSDSLRRKSRRTPATSTLSVITGAGTPVATNGLPAWTRRSRSSASGRTRMAPAS